jgi:hypothetical protein
MQSHFNRILTTHTGSLHRPPDFEEMFRQKLAGEKFDESAFEARLRSSSAGLRKTCHIPTMLPWSIFYRQNECAGLSNRSR